MSEGVQSPAKGRECSCNIFLEAPLCIPLWFPAVPSALQAPGEEMWHTHCAGSTWHGTGPVVLVLITPRSAWHWLQSMAGWFPLLPNSHTAPARGRASTGATQDGKPVNIPIVTALVQLPAGHCTPGPRASPAREGFFGTSPDSPTQTPESHKHSTGAPCTAHSPCARMGILLLQMWHLGAVGAEAGMQQLDFPSHTREGCIQALTHTHTPSQL